MPDTRGAVSLAPTREIGYARAGAAWWDINLGEETPELRWPDCLPIYEAMRRQDPQVKSVLRAVTMPVLRTPWYLEQGDASDEVTEHVAVDLGLPIQGAGTQPKVLRTRGRFSWLRHLFDSLTMLPIGHSFFEQVARPDERTGLLRLRKLAPRWPRSLQAINVARDGGLESIVQWADAGQELDKPIPVNRLVAYVNEQETGDWHGTSLLRSCYKSWLLKDRALRVGMQTIERNGMGMPRYTAPEQATAGDIEKGAALAEAWRAGDDSGVGIPFGSKLDLVGVTGTLPDVMPFIRYQDEQIARAVLAHFLNLGTQTGSWALGSTFADFFTLSLQTVAMQVRDVANAHVVEDLVDWNWGEDTPAPRIGFQEIGSRQQLTADVLKTLSDAGIVLPDRALEEMVRELFGLPPKSLAGRPAPTDPVADRAAPSAPPTQEGTTGAQ